MFSGPYFHSHILHFYFAHEIMHFWVYSWDNVMNMFMWKYDITGIFMQVRDQRDNTYLTYSWYRDQTLDSLMLRDDFSEADKYLYCKGMCFKWFLYRGATRSSDNLHPKAPCYIVIHSRMNLSPCDLLLFLINVFPKLQSLCKGICIKHFQIIFQPSAKWFCP